MADNVISISAQEEWKKTVKQRVKTRNRMRSRSGAAGGMAEDSGISVMSDGDCKLVVGVGTWIHTAVTIQ